MYLEDLQDFSSSILKLLELNTYFEITKSEDGYNFRPLSKEEFGRHIDSIHNFAKAFVEDVAIHDITVMSNKEITPLMEISEFFQKFLKKNKKISSKDPWKKQMEEISNYALSLALGAKISPTQLQKIDPEARKFILNNEYEKKSLIFRQPLRYSWDEGILFSVEVQPKLFHQVPFKRMKREEITSDKGVIIGYRFYLETYFLFQTDKKLKLMENFSLLTDGIAQYHPTKSFTLYRTLKFVPEDVGRLNWIEIQLSERNSQISLVVSREDGSIFSIGICNDQFSCPDPGYFSTAREKKSYKFKIQCTLEQVQLLKKKIEDARFFHSQKRTSLTLMETVSGIVNKPLAPKKPLISKKRWIAFLLLPVGVFRCFLNKQCSLPNFRELIRCPHDQYYLDTQVLQEMLKKEVAVGK